MNDILHEKKAIGYKWLFKTKCNPDGTKERKKPDWCYEETFALVAKMTTVKSLLAVAALKGYILHEIDVKNAFLHGKLQEDVYMQLPEGYNGPTEKIVVRKGE